MTATAWKAGDASPHVAVAGTVAAKWAKGTGGPAGDEAYNLVPAIAGPLGDAAQSGGFQTTDLDNNGAVCVNMEHALHATGNANSVRLSDVSEALTRSEFKGHTAVLTPEVAPTLTSANDPSRSPQSAEVTQQVAAVHSASHAVRRLTPRECERLQGFPDDWTAIEYRGKPASDGPRYKALGNSMAVNVMRWIGFRMHDRSAW